MSSPSFSSFEIHLGTFSILCSAHFFTYIQFYKKLQLLGIHSANTYAHTKIPYYKILDECEVLKSPLYTQHTNLIYSYFLIENLHQTVVGDLNLAKNFSFFLSHGATHNSMILNIHQNLLQAVIFCSHMLELNSARFSQHF